MSSGDFSEALGTLAPEQQQLFRDTAIHEDGPGTILRDFQALLDFVGIDGIRVAGKHKLLPMKLLGELNARLARPLELRLKRPQLRSYPNIQGLYLLLRATGLAQVQHSGAKACLTLAPETLECWRGLNPTERYFTLLEAWMLHARPEMVGERRGRGWVFLHECLTAWQYITMRRRILAVREPSRPRMLGIGTDYYHLALMEMFGLVALRHAPPAKGAAWRPARVKPLPFGDAVFALLTGALFSSEVEEALESGKVVFGRWQPLFQPFYPEWRSHLRVPRPKFRKGVFVFKASLGKVWRRIAVPARGNLDDLAGWILESFDFDRDHLYCFTYKGRWGAEVRVDGPHCPEGLCTLDVRVGDLPLPVGGEMTFLFDFGDDWLFDVKLDRIDPPDRRRTRPTLLDAQGDAPPQYPRWQGDWDEEESEDEDREEAEAPEDRDEPADKDGLKPHDE